MKGSMLHNKNSSNLNHFRLMFLTLDESSKEEK
jgi:hypothetical protein